LTILLPTEHIHALHHELHVPYAFGAFYNHPVETILIDAIGFPLCLRAARLSTRQTMVASCVWTMKAVVDHCGYAFPYDPCNLFCSQSQWYHDVHHQVRSSLRKLPKH
jgi:sphinganine C4-monooxygenase